MKFSLSKKDGIKLIATGVLSVVILLTSSLIRGGFFSQPEERDWRSFVLYGLFHSDVQVQLYATEEEFTELKRLIQLQLNQYDVLFDRYYPATNENDELVANMYYLNAHVNEGPIPVHPDLFELLSLGIEYTELTEGRFHLAVGALTDLWAPYFDPYDSKGQLNLSNEVEDHVEPSSAEILAAKACIPAYDELSDYVILNEENSTVEILDLPGCSTQISLSVGAIAKGFATEKMAEAIRDLGYFSIFNSGHSSIQFDTDPTLSKTIYLINPLDPVQTISTQPDYAAVLTTNQNIAFSTSGDYEQNFLIDNGQDLVRRHHILDVTTGYSSTLYRSVSVMTDDSTLADILSTALMNQSIAEGVSLLQILRNQGHYVEAVWLVEALDEAEPIITIHQTEGISIHETSFDVMHVEEAEE